MSLSLEDTVDTLPDLIKSLAQQLSSRDAQLKIERAKYTDKLSAMKEEQDSIRSGREELEEGLRKERELNANLTTVFSLEKAELLKKIELLEQAAVHHTDLLSQTRHELEFWKGQYVTTAENSRLQLEGLTNKIDELAARFRKSNARSSPTVVSSVSPNHPTSMEKPPPAHPDVFNTKTTNPVATPKRVTPPTIRQARVDNAIAPSGGSSDGSHSMSFKSKRVNYQSPRREPLSDKVESPSISTPQRSRKKSQTNLPSDRVIRTAHYEIKEEDSEDLTYPEASSSKIVHPRVEHEDQLEVPSAKRRKTRKQNIRRIDDDHIDKEEVDDTDEDEGYHRVEDPRRLPPPKFHGRLEEDFDDMAIGAEHNHKEVYGSRRVHVVRRTSPQRTRDGAQSGSTVGNRRKVGSTPAATPGRPLPAKTKR